MSYDIPRISFVEVSVSSATSAATTDCGLGWDRWRNGQGVMKNIQIFIQCLVILVMA